MLRLLLIAAFAGLALARPETYREKEDFQFSRSSSDDGTKSGFYGAQRGNMGGNYERAHNMDTVAQKQMSSAINQVAGELDTSDVNAGSVFTAAKTRGVYGQSQYDLSNLHGRNFHENSFADNSQSSAIHSGYGTHSAYGGRHSAYTGQNAGYSGYNANADVETLHRNNLQALDQISSGHREFGGQSTIGREYHYTGNQASSYNQRQSDRQYATKNRLVGANGSPVKIIIRPGSTVNVPVAAETYDDRETAASSQHSLNRDVEVVANPDRQFVTRPSTSEKHYESSYKYHKEWEKQDTKPVTVPLSRPTVPESQLYDIKNAVDAGLQGNTLGTSDYQTAAHSQSHYQANSQYNTQQQAESHGIKNAYVARGTPVRIAIRPGSTVNVPVTAEVYEDKEAAASSQHSVNRDVEVLANPDYVTRPVTDEKHYESSYKYHKEWEKQDTKPVTIPLSIPIVPENHLQGNSIATSDYQTAANSQSHYQSNSQHNTQQQATSFGTHDNAYTRGYGNNAALVGVDTASAPKKYESSYSYHKSWERQGDPYVIQPVAAVPAARLTSNSQQGYGSQYGSQYRRTHQSYTKSGALVDCDCDDDTHSRVARSVDSVNQRHHDYNPYLQNDQQEELTQQVQNEDYAHYRSRQGYERLEDLGQQTQHQWEQFGRATQDRAEDLGQQTQEAWGNIEQINQGEFNKHFKDVNEHVKPVWEQSEDESKHTLVHAVVTTDNSPSFKSTTGKLDFPMLPPELEPTLNHPNTYAHTMHKESGFESQQHSEEFMHDFKPEKPNKNKSSIQNLWDQIDGLEQTLSSNQDSMDSHWHGYEQHDLSSQSSMQNWHSNSGLVQNSHHNQNHFRWQYPEQVPSEELPPSTIKSSDDGVTSTSTTTAKPFVNHKNEKPKDIGRGDVGDDDSTNGMTQPSEHKPTPQIYTSFSNQQINPYKTPEEIEALSLTKENDQTHFITNHSVQSNDQSVIANTQSDVEVLSLQQQWLNELKKNLSETSRNTADSYSSSNNYSENHNIHQVNQGRFDQQKPVNNIRQDSEHKDNVDYVYQSSFDQQNSNDQQFLDLVHEAINHDQQSQQTSFDQHSGNEFENLGQESTNLHAPSDSLSVFDTQSRQQQYTGQEKLPSNIPEATLNSFNSYHPYQHEDLGQETQSFDQSSDGQFENLGQETVSLHSPNEPLSSFDHHQLLNQHEFLGQETEKLNIPSEAFSLQNENQEKQTTNVHATNTFDTQSLVDNLDQQSKAVIGIENNTDQQSYDTDQQLEDLGQHSVDLQQQEKIERFNKYVYDPSDKSKNLEQTGDPASFDARSPLHQAKEDDFYNKQYIAPSLGTRDSQVTLQGHGADSKLPEAEVLATVTEVATDKPGFWKSVGNKFVSAKDKVSSWFHKS